MALLSTQEWSEAIQGQAVMISTSVATGGTANTPLRSYWSGSNPATGSGAIPTNRTSGALQFVSPPEGSTAYLGKIKLTQDSVGMLLIFDRLWHNTGLAINNSTQTVNSQALTRHTDGKGVQIFIEFYTTGVGYASATSSITVSYTNQDGVSGRTASFPSPMDPSDGFSRRVAPLTLQSGDYGVRSIQSFTSTAALYGSSQPVVGLVLGYVHSLVPSYSPQVVKTYNYLSLGSTEIDREACLSLYKFCGTDAPGGVYGSVRIAQG